MIYHIMLTNMNLGKCQSFFYKDKTNALRKLQELIKEGYLSTGNIQKMRKYFYQFKKKRYDISLALTEIPTED